MLVANSTLKEVVHGMSCLSLIPGDKSCLHKANEQGVHRGLEPSVETLSREDED